MDPVEIPLYRKDGTIAGYTLVDAEDFERPEVGGAWSLSRSGYAYRTTYVRGSGRKNQRNTWVWLHRLIIGAAVGQKADHINGNRLDNRKENLRIATQAQNMQNLPLYKNNTSGHRGVCWHAKAQKWWARVYLDGRHINLGLFKKIEDAVAAYDKAAERLHPFSTRRDKYERSA